MPLEQYTVGAHWPIRYTYAIDGVEAAPDSLTVEVVSPSGARTTKHSTAPGELTLTGTGTYSLLALLDEPGTWRNTITAVKSGLENEVVTGAVYVQAAP